VPAIGGGPTGRPWRRVRARVLAASDVCHLCGHLGSEAVDHVISRKLRPDLAQDPANLRPVHGSPWQRLVADVAMEVDPATGRLAYAEVDLTTPRQSGKTTLELGVLVHRARRWAGPRMLYGAQDRIHARAIPWPRPGSAMSLSGWSWPTSAAPT
jgi:hypothetical protein